MIALLVAVAGAGGVLARYGLSSVVHGDALPWTTDVINGVGSFLLGMLVVPHGFSPPLRPESRSELWCSWPTLAPSQRSTE